MYNKVVIMGRISNEFTTIANGKGIYFSVAVPYNKDHVDFIDVAVYGPVKDTLLKYSKKGLRVLIDGYIHSYKSEKKQTTKHMVVANRVTLVDFNNENDDSKKQFDEGGEDLPF